MVFVGIFFQIRCNFATNYLLWQLLMATMMYLDTSIANCMNNYNNIIRGILQFFEPFRVLFFIENLFHFEFIPYVSAKQTWHFKDQLWYLKLKDLFFIDKIEFFELEQFYNEPIFATKLVYKFFTIIIIFDSPAPVYSFHLKLFSYELSFLMDIWQP